MKIGIVFGCFIPMHDGHLSLIQQTLSEKDKIIIGICGSDNDRGKDFIPFGDRIELVKKAVNFKGRTIFSVVDDQKIGLTGKFDLPSWKIWCDELFANANINPLDKSCEFTWYSGDKDYLDKISQIYPNHKFTHVKRSYIPISGTMIRKNPEKYIRNIHPEFVNYLRDKKIIK